RSSTRRASPSCSSSRTCRSPSRSRTASTSWKRASFVITQRRTPCARTPPSSISTSESEGAMIPFDQILVQIVNGLVNGMILALVASGLTLIFGIMDIVNFAHGDLFMLGAYVGTTAFLTTGNFWVALVVSVLVMAPLGAAL